MADEANKNIDREPAADVEDQRGMRRKAVHASGWLLASMTFQTLGTLLPHPAYFSPGLTAFSRHHIF